MTSFSKAVFLLMAAVVSHAVHAANTSSTDALSADQIVAASDIARGGGQDGAQDGVEWVIDITGQDAQGPIEKRTYVVRANSDDSLAQATFPPREAGGRLLQNGRSMWFGKATLTKPVSISARQKMIGMVSNGDIASTNYARDYDATILRTEPVNDENAYVLNLVAKNHFVTYDRIVYYVSTTRLVPLKAEFYTVSGQLFKVAVFEMNNRLKVGGAMRPFVSSMTIRDAIQKSNYSVLQYSDVRAKQFNPSLFSVDSLNRP